MNQFLQRIIGGAKKKPPAVMFGKRLIVVPNDKVPKDHILLCVHPDANNELSEKIADAFAKWIAKEPIV